MARRIFYIILIGCLMFSPVISASSATVFGEQDVIDRVLMAAPDTLIAREELGEAEDHYMASKSIFDTNLSAETNYIRDEYQRSSAFFGTRTDTANWNIGVAKKLPIGTSTSLEWSNQRDRIFGAPNVGGQAVFPNAPTYESIVNFSLSHPLMRNFAGLNDRSTVAEAGKAFEAADLNTKYRIANIAHSSLVNYWRWVLSYKYIAYYRQAVNDARDFLNITLSRKKLGTVEETDVLAAEANYEAKKNGLLSAERLAEQIEKNFKVALAIGVEEKILPRDKHPRFIKSEYQTAFAGIQAALENRWDFLAQKQEIERQNIKLVSSKNKRWPELDLVGTLAVNGLTTSYSRTMSNVDHPYYVAGVTFSIPLENRLARAEYKTAKHQQKKAVVLLKKMENEISNTISELVRRRDLSKQMVVNATRAERLQKDKLFREMNKYRMGRSSSEMIVLYQDDLVRSQVSSLDAWADYIQTVLDLRLQENTLIEF